MVFQRRVYLGGFFYTTDFGATNSTKSTIERSGLPSYFIVS